jgi:hypothetical protein
MESCAVYSLPCDVSSCMTHAHVLGTNPPPLTRPPLPPPPLPFNFRRVDATAQGTALRMVVAPGFVSGPSTGPPQLRQWQSLCVPGSFCPGDGFQYACPAGVVGNTSGLASPICSGACPPGCVPPACSDCAAACMCRYLPTPSPPPLPPHPLCSPCNSACSSTACSSTGWSACPAEVGWSGVGYTVMCALASDVPWRYRCRALIVFHLPLLPV